MNICIDAQPLNSQIRSVLQTYTEGLLNGLYSTDHDNQYYLVYHSLTRKPEDMPGPARDRYEKAVLRVPDREFYGREYLLNHFVLPGFINRNRIDIFHETAGYHVPRVNGTFRILTVHDLRTLTIKDEFWKQNINQYQRAVNDVDLCVTVSECTKRDLMKHFDVPEKKVKAVHLGTDQRFKKIANDQVKKIEEKFGMDEPYLLSIASVPRKNPEGIIRSFAKSKSKSKFVLVMLANRHRVQYEELAKQLGVEKRIKFIEYLSDDEMVALYNGCYCFLFPSLYEGFGLPILEAMNCGAAVITSNISSCPEVAGEAAILVDPANEDELAGAIDEICASSSLRDSYVEKGFRRAQEFGWDKFAREMKEIYSSI